MNPSKEQTISYPEGSDEECEQDEPEADPETEPLDLQLELEESGDELSPPLDHTSLPHAHTQDSGAGKEGRSLSNLDNMTPDDDGRHAERERVSSSEHIVTDDSELGSEPHRGWPNRFRKISGASDTFRTPGSAVFTKNLLLRSMGGNPSDSGGVVGDDGGKGAVGGMGKWFRRNAHKGSVADEKESGIHAAGLASPRAVPQSSEVRQLDEDFECDGDLRLGHFQ